jgi:hypothetical protein
MRRYIALLLCCFTLNAQTIFSTKRIEGSKILVTAEYFHSRVIDNVYSIDEHPTYYSFITKSGVIVNYSKSTLIGWEDISDKKEVIDTAKVLIPKTDNPMEPTHSSTRTQF